MGTGVSVVSLLLDWVLLTSPLPTMGWVQLHSEVFFVFCFGAGDITQGLMHVR